MLATLARYRQPIEFTIRARHKTIDRIYYMVAYAMYIFNDSVNE